MAIPIALLEYVFILYLEVNSLKTFPEMKAEFNLQMQQNSD